MLDEQNQGFPHSKEGSLLECMSYSERRKKQSWKLLSLEGVANTVVEESQCE